MTDRPPLPPRRRCIVSVEGVRCSNQPRYPGRDESSFCWTHDDPDNAETKAWQQAVAQVPAQEERTKPPLIADDLAATLGVTTGASMATDERQAGLREARYDAHGGPWFPNSPEEWLREALVPFAAVAASEASRPRSDDGHRTGTGDLTTLDWRRLHAALVAQVPAQPCTCGGNEADADLRDSFGHDPRCPRFVPAQEERPNPGQLADALWNAFSTEAHREHESDDCDTCRWYRTLAVGDSERLIREYRALGVETKEEGAGS